MSQIFSSRLFLVAVLGVPTLAACSKDPCFPASKGKQYQISIVEIWDDNSQFLGGQTSLNPCPVDFDLKAGGSFVVQVDGFLQGSPGCSCGEGHAVQAPDGWTWEGVEGAVCGGNFFAMRTGAKNGSCSGDVNVSIEASHLPTGSAAPGQPPPACLQRSFQRGAPTCGLSENVCNDSFVVEIVEL